jgi:GNAT superfamily N-acetyltransferase
MRSASSSRRLGTDGNGYVLEDLTVKAGPAHVGPGRGERYTRHRGRCGGGGDELRRRDGPLHRADRSDRQGRARELQESDRSRGKAVRAEPFSALYEQGKVRHVGIFPRLEDELCAISTTGYTGPVHRTARTRSSGRWPSSSRRSSQVRRKRSPKAIAQQASLTVAIPEALPAHMRDKTREITHVFCEAAARGQRLATALMNFVCQEADAGGYTLVLTAREYISDSVFDLQANGPAEVNAPRPNEAQLIAWYEKFGFTKLQDTDKGTFMARQVRERPRIKPIRLAVSRALH